MHKRVLLVEDDRVSRESLTYLLRSLGHDVRAAYSAEEARAIVESFNPDIALLDVRLPGLPGDAFAVHLRSLYPHLRIIFVSGELRIDHPERFGDNVSFIPKPVDFSALLTTIQD